MNLKRLLAGFTALSLSAVMCLGFAGCDSSKTESDSQTVSNAKVESGNYKGSFVITLHPEYAPDTCKNFEKLVKDKFYNGLTFHRVVNGFMAQGGDPEGTGNGGAKETIKGEFYSNGYTKNVMSHVGGVVSMARSNENDSASSQFFICFSDIDEKQTNALNGNYAAFGQVTEGMEVVDGLEKIDVKAATEGGEVSTPVKTVKIEEAKMIDDDKDGKHRVKFTISYTVPDEKKSSSADTTSGADSTSADTNSTETSAVSEDSKEKQ